MLKVLKLTSQKGDATLVMKPPVLAGRDGQSVVHMSIYTRGGHYNGARLTLEDVKALVKPGAGTRTTPFSREVYVGSSLASAGGAGGKSYTLFYYPAPRAKTRQTIIDWLNAAIAEFDTKKEPPVAITPTSHTITDSDGDSVTFSASGKGGVKLEFRGRPGTDERGTMTLDASRSKALVEALRKAADDGAYTTIRPGGSRTLDISAGWIDGPISVRVSASEQTAAADFVEKSMGLSKAEPEAAVKDEPKFKVGDRVKIVGNPTSLGREPEVGREGTVKDVDDTLVEGVPQFKVKPTVGTTWWYSASALEKIEETKPAVAPTPVKTAVPVFGPVGKVEPRPESYTRAADALSSGFVWESTPEGRAFWQAIHDRLRDMADAAATIGAVGLAADYKSPCPAGYETLAMAMLRRGKPDDATVDLGTRVSRRAGELGVDRVWVDAPLVAAGRTDKVRAYPRVALASILDHLGLGLA